MIATSNKDHFSFFKRGRCGNVVRYVREKYRRDDIGFGVVHGNSLDSQELHKLIADSFNQTLIFVDTNIALHEIDLLEQQSPATSLMVFCQTVLQELRKLNLSAFKRIQELINSESRNIIFYPNELAEEAQYVRTSQESVDESSTRSIIEAVKVFYRGLEAPAKVVFVTNDLANKTMAESAGIVSYDMRTYLLTFAADKPELLDFLTSSLSAHLPLSQLQQSIYAEHVGLGVMNDGVRVRKYLRGALRVKKDDWRDCYVIVHENSSTGKSERVVVHVKGKDRVNRALDGDIVAIELIAEGEEEEMDVDEGDKKDVVREQKAEKQDIDMANTEAEPTFEVIEGIHTVDNKKKNSKLQGRVVGIMKRNLRQLAGSFDETSAVDLENDEFLVQFLPVERRLPRILVRTQRMKELLGMRLLVAIDAWPSNSEWPCGHFVKVFGKQGHRAVENEVLLFELGLANTAFSNAVMACLPPPDWHITENMIAARTDLRHLPITSVDPPGCKDIDDALHCILLPNGNYQAGVHIADVSHFVLPDTPIDKEAAQRCTSTYLVEKRLDMLPEMLTTRLCSLRSNEDHLTFSVLWEMDANANIINVEFCKSIIHSKASLSYAQAQDILDSPEVSSDPTHASLRNLNKIARILKQRRIEAGALTLASPEVRFKLDEETQNPLDVALYTLREANSMVEEWMLLANITVGKKTLQHFPTLSILRRHQPPSKDQFAPLLHAAKIAGINLDISSSLALAQSLDAAQRASDPFFNKLLRILSTRCMMPAQYFCSGELPKEDWHHYGLAAPVYTHFTSPIRRYADVLVHRLLAAAIGVSPLPTANADRTKQQDQCTQMNRKHRAAQLAQRASVRLYTSIFFKDRVCEEDAHVLNITEERIDILVPRYGFEAPIFVEDIRSHLKLESVTFRAEKVALDLASRKKVRCLAIFDKVKVVITTVENDNRERSLSIKLSTNF